MKQKISYVLPVFNEAEGISKFWEVLIAEVAKWEPRYEFEFIFIDDGSRDASLAILTKFADSDSRVKIVSFSRNFGHQIAITAGLDYADGDAVIIMDTDLQDQPETSFELVQQWEKGFEVVFAQRRSRKDSFFKRFTASAFYRILEKFADVKIPRDTGDFRLMDAKVVLVMRKMRERNRFMRGLVASLGFKQVGVLFDRDERFAGKTNYPLKKMIKLAVDGMLSFSSTPITLINRLGLLLIPVGILTGILGLVLFVAGERYWSSIFLITGCVYFHSGLIIFSISIVGQYVTRIYSEVQARPLYIVSDLIGIEDRSRG